MILIAAVLLAAPASANTVDVISSKLKTGNAFSACMSITEEFNNPWGKAYGYNA